jgi:hypothetical protein
LLRRDRYWRECREKCRGKPQDRAQEWHGGHYMGLAAVVVRAISARLIHWINK